MGLWCWKEEARPEGDGAFAWTARYPLYVHLTTLRFVQVTLNKVSFSEYIHLSFKDHCWSLWLKPLHVRLCTYVCVYVHVIVSMCGVRCPLEVQSEIHSFRYYLLSFFWFFPPSKTRRDIQVLRKRVLITLAKRSFVHCVYLRSELLGGLTHPLPPFPSSVPQVTKWRKDISKEMRGLDRSIRKIEIEEKKIQIEIKKHAKAGNMDAVSSYLLKRKECVDRLLFSTVRVREDLRGLRCR